MPETWTDLETWTTYVYSEFDIAYWLILPSYTYFQAASDTKGSEQRYMQKRSS
jgi:hypothetical protein